MRPLYAFLAVAVLSAPVRAADNPCSKPHPEPKVAPIVEGRWLHVQEACDLKAKVNTDGTVPESGPYHMLVVGPQGSSQEGRHEGGGKYSNGWSPVSYNKDGFARCAAGESDPRQSVNVTHYKHRTIGQTEMLIEVNGTCPDGKPRHVLYVRAKETIRFPRMDDAGKPSGPGGKSNRVVAITPEEQAALSAPDRTKTMGQRAKQACAAYGYNSAPDYDVIVLEPSGLSQTGILPEPSGSKTVVLSQAGNWGRMGAVFKTLRCADVPRA